MNYRKGAIGALTDEYEKALNELKIVFKSISDVAFLKTDFTKEQDFQSIRNIATHIVRSGYVYSNYARKSFEMEVIPYLFSLNSIQETFVEIDKMFAYHIATFEDKWLMSDAEMMKTIIVTSWTTYDLEALLEHAIVHILRHRLQIQKIIN
ncbi:hypothetical protein OX283_003600 [Flavobacterium sp. SUN052]|uniref:hypothetical protein n=1 Tax=Flavobacterium sp. SUN052 TaxID=3002441 RepID=UPI00237ED9D8|nr:hypothetical protein [Flavobacterium sp. SUN052]MEC4003728.1 hypothetical protein [Flavobacterium sp. SUN052]